MEIENISLDKIKPYPKNPRKNEKAVKIVVKSIKEFGFRVPLILDKNNVIIAGHTRLKAAEELEMKEIPVIWAEDLTPEQVKAFRIMDNKSQEFAEWDTELLKEEFYTLEGTDAFEFTGFSSEEISKIWDKEPKEDDFEMPKEPKYKIEQGEIWQLGNHRLMCGNSTKKEHVDALMDGKKAKGIVTDPPYNVDAPGEKIINDNISEEESKKIHKDFVKFAVMEKDSSAIVFHSPSKFLSALEGFESNKWIFNRALWMFEEGGRAFPWHGWYMTGDIILCFQKGKGSWVKQVPTGVPDTYKHSIGQGSNEQGIKPGKNAKKESLYHPTLKPLWVVLDTIRHIIGEIYDPFGGAGTTLIACEQLDRKCYMMELDPYYCSVIIERWEKLTKKQAKKL